MSHTNNQSRLNALEQSPELVKKLQDFSMAIANSGHIEPRLSRGDSPSAGGRHPGAQRTRRE
jgi:hypothetical protein